ncbi:DUF1016 N-terminal domain-containing protein [Flavobacterium sp. LS1R10]|uniref:DUF1016 N-terminal domain-containing protein n=1 Tax=Flavobacterium sp. LS1R10 TaxID=2497482 RepID=UPI000F846114|nr:DUF1016 N-terminal domain-containing protein [Flavobacterium sp. LS1R10]RTY73235.1 DUF1016 family protein [Flavobacterium sp. LS1R10]
MKDEENTIPNNSQNKILFSQVVALLQNTRQQVLRTVNSTMVYTYFEMGRMIVEEEQSGKERAECGKQLLKGLSEQLTIQFGKGFSIRNLEQIKQFYITYSKSDSLTRILEIRNSQSLTAEFKFQKAQTVSVDLNKLNYQKISGFLNVLY